MKKATYLSSVGPYIERYISLKQALGRRWAVECSILKHLDQFLQKEKVDLTAESFSEWCHAHRHHSATVRRNWMRVARNLCLYRRRTNPKCFVPDSLLFPACHQPVQPHIFTEDEIIRLLGAVDRLAPANSSPIRAENFRLALVLLYSTGMRRGELLKLTIGDYDLTERTLLIRESKFHKSRILPLSADGWREVEKYLEIRRRRKLPISSDSPLLWNGYGDEGYYDPMTLGTCFRGLFRSCGIQTSFGKLPRLHDFRHAFAVRALLRWYQKGEDVQAKLPFLSIYMGHVSIVSTQYYLHFIEELVGAASDRFAKRYSTLVSPSTNRGGA
jgi:integrase